MGIEAGAISRQLTSCPPQVGKSMFMSMIFPVWYLGRHPDRRVILGSYNATWGAHWGREARNFMAEFGMEYFGVTVDPERSARDDWGLIDARGKPLRGSMRTMGMDSGITGNPCELFLIDDPFKGWEEASSEAHRQKVWMIYASCVQTRMRSGGTICITFTPWHEDDLGGRLMAAQKDRWNVIRIPALAEEPSTPEERSKRNGYAAYVGSPDPLGREPGEALCPAMYDEAHYAEVKATWPDVFDALYQCNPHASEGNKFKRAWFKDKVRADVPESFSEIVRYWDKAATQGSGNYSSGVLMGAHGKDVWVVNVRRDRLEPRRRDEMIRRTAETDTRLYHNVVTWGEHAGNDAKEVGDNFIKNLIGFPAYVEGTGSKDKITRAHPFASYCQSGHVFIAEGDWNADYINELVDFRDKCQYDDQVDASSGAFGKIALGDAYHEPFLGPKRTVYDPIAAILGREVAAWN